MGRQTPELEGFLELSKLSILQEKYADSDPRKTPLKPFDPSPWLGNQYRELPVRGPDEITGYERFAHQRTSGRMRLWYPRTQYEQRQDVYPILPTSNW